MSHYFINDSNVIKKLMRFETWVLDKKYIFNTDSGVFSREHLDFGSRLLIESISSEHLEGKILDVGCGYGSIGIILAKNANVFVHMIDINLRALELAKENALINKVQNVSIYESNIYENVNDIFNVIITNPPIRAGKKIVYEILEKAKDYLKPDGELWFVIRKQQGAESLIKYFQKVYKLSIINKTKGYYVVKAQK